MSGARGAAVGESAGVAAAAGTGSTFTRAEIEAARCVDCRARLHMSASERERIEKEVSVCDTHQRS